MDTMSWGATTMNCLLAGSSPAHGEQIATGHALGLARFCVRSSMPESTASGAGMQARALPDIIMASLQ